MQNSKFRRTAAHVSWLGGSWKEQKTWHEKGNADQQKVTVHLRKLQQCNACFPFQKI